MGFFARLGHGFMIGLHSLVFGLRHFSVYWYMLAYAIVMIPVVAWSMELIPAAMHGGGAGFVVVTLLRLVLMTFALMFVVAIARRVVYYFGNKKDGFFGVMAMDVKMYVALGIYELIFILLEYFMAYAQASGSDLFDWFAFLVFLGWGICTMFFVTIVAVENCGFFDAVGRSVRVL